MPTFPEPPLSKDVNQRSLITRSILASSLAEAGIATGDAVCVHASLSRLGYVCGAAQAVIEGLQDAVGAEGTVMMPAFSGELSDPATWRFPPVPADWIERIRRETPAYDPRLTPTRQMGAVAELFRNYPNVLRSPHPHSSFAACGAQARQMVERHPLAFRFGPQSPLGRLAALDGKVLLLGAGVDRASFIYLAQHLSGIGEDVLKSVPMTVNGEMRWVECRDIAVSNRMVSTGVEHLLERGIAQRHPVGDAAAIIFRARDALAALLDWGWRDAVLPNHVSREPTPIPKDWSLWLG